MITQPAEGASPDTVEVMNEFEINHGTTLYLLAQAYISDFEWVMAGGFYSIWGQLGGKHKETVNEIPQKLWTRKSFHKTTTALPCLSHWAQAQPMPLDFESPIDSQNKHLLIDNI